MNRFIAFITMSIASIAAIAQDASEIGIDQKIDQAFGEYTGWFVNFIFYSIPFGENLSVPWVLFPLVGAAVYFTFYFKFINIRGFMTSIGVVRGRYDDLEEGGHKVEASDSVHTVDGDAIDTIRVEGAEEGEVSHFQALTAALSATVGLGNIAGVAVAISIGGPGATFWMIIAGLISMSTKFVECTLGVKYREIDENGRVYGGPMYYLRKGLMGRGMAGFGKVLAVLFAVMCIGGSFGGGNMFQSNQAFVQVEAFMQSPVAEMSDMSKAVNEQVVVAGVTNPQIVKSVSETEVVLTSTVSGNEMTMPIAEFTEAANLSPMSGYGWLFGIIMAVFVGIVIIGGIKSIAKVTDKIVPFMVGIYVIAALAILAINYNLIPEAFGQIFAGAFGWEGVAGGAVGVLIQGFRRAAFSNEAGVGSASIAHAAVKTKNPASEGLVALLEPFIDTVVVCTMTALVLVISNIDGGLMTYGQPVSAGVEVTSKAFEQSFSWFPWILTVAVVLFAFSTMISWSYYGYQAWTYLFGRVKWSEYLYKAVFCLFVIVGAAASLGSVIGFSDAMIFAMLVPNIIGLLILAPEVRSELASYIGKIKALKSKNS